MQKIALLSLVAISCFFIISCSHKREGKPRVLVFTKASGYVHASIPTGTAAIQKLGAENAFDVDTTSNAAWFNEDSLKKYAAVIFLSTTGNVLDPRQETAFMRYIQAGGNYVGIHAAADCEYDWRWYGRLVGGYFKSHPKEQQMAKFTIKDKDFGATRFFTDTIWQHKDELYNYKMLNPDNHVLITIDETSYTGGENGAFHPMSWYHEYDGGRSFYTALGHTEEAWKEENFLKHLLGGIQYAIGDNEELNLSKAKAEYPPEDDRFTKTQLSVGEFFEPTEMTILPNLDILVTQRRGEILLYKNETKKIQQAGFLNVYFKASVPGVNAEEGVLGLAKDPNFAKNNWVYIYYSPVDTSVNRLSRFTFKDDKIDMSSEKRILDVWSQRQICCHTGGSIAFGPDGLLYLSTGDNSTPFDEPGVKFVNSGFSPMNDVPGHQQYDARRSSGNTNDLRGKILRIRVKEDGTYEIPDGNLFAKGEAGTRPEIFVMGNRNPYRISVDQKTSFLYWGEVGPDAANDSMATRGPRGYDEVNQARKAGFFGWPLFIGDNYAYHNYNYATGEYGPAYDPKHPQNLSANNTGIKDLPPSQPAFIWYPYANSNQFPQVGTGGRNAMAGPVYYTELFPKDTRLPDYFNGKLIIYDWIRGWIKAVTMAPNGDFDRLEPVFNNVKVNSLIDMEVGPDGKLYLLEYGTGWFSKNPDAGLARIDYNGGNIAPKIAGATIDKTSGKLPFTVKAKVDARDPDNGKLTYVWNLGTTTKETTTPELDYTFTTPGDYKVSVEVKDNDGSSSKINIADIYAGNEVPSVSIQITGGNRSFFLPGRPFSYQVSAKDNDTAAIDPANFFVSVDYKDPGFDNAANTEGHQEGSAVVSGKSLMLSLDCKSCHKEVESSVGPAYSKVAEKYRNDAAAVSALPQKIINGTKGVWGEAAMPAHPSLSPDDAQTIVSWIMTLGKPESVAKSLPPSGSYTPTGEQKPGNVLVLTASYTDKGGNNIKALTGTNKIILPSNYRAFNGREEVKGFVSARQTGAAILRFPDTTGYFGVDSLDLTGVHSVKVITRWRNPPETGFGFEVRLDALNGKIVGRGNTPKPGKDDRTGETPISLTPTEDNKLHKLYFLFKAPDPSKPVRAGVATLQFN